MITWFDVCMCFRLNVLESFLKTMSSQSYAHISSLCRDPDLVRRIGEATALEVRGTGIQYVFAPCIAVSTQIDFVCLNFGLCLQIKALSNTISAAFVLHPKT